MSIGKRFEHNSIAPLASPQKFLEIRKGYSRGALWVEDLGNVVDCRFEWGSGWFAAGIQGTPIKVATWVLSVHMADDYHKSWTYQAVNFFHTGW